MVGRGEKSGEVFSRLEGGGGQKEKFLFPFRNALLKSRIIFKTYRSASIFPLFSKASKDLTMVSSSSAPRIIKKLI